MIRIELFWPSFKKMGGIEGLNQFSFGHFIHWRTPLKKAAKNNVAKIRVLLRASLILKERERCICILWYYSVCVCVYMMFIIKFRLHFESLVPFRPMLHAKQYWGAGQRMSAEVVIPEL